MVNVKADDECIVTHTCCARHGSADLKPSNKMPGISVIRRKRNRSSVQQILQFLYRQLLQLLPKPQITWWLKRKIEKYSINVQASAARQNWKLVATGDLVNTSYSVCLKISCGPGLVRR